jgi:hypothetical protein
MLISTYHNILFRLCLLFTLCTCLWFFSSNAASEIRPQDSAQFKKQLPVSATQLPADNGIIPVELQCEDAELSAANALEKLSCVIKNNTKRFIVAGTIYTTITIEKEGKSLSIGSYDTFDTFLHPDFREDHPGNMIHPRGNYRLDDLPGSFEDGVVIKAIAVRVDYVEFADHAALGPNRGGAQIIAETREGAAKYKKWLARKYDESKGSMKEIVALLDTEQPLAEELEIKTANQEHGAIMYRNYARRTYQNKGAEALTRHLKQTSASDNQ